MQARDPLATRKTRETILQSLPDLKILKLPVYDYDDDYYIHAEWAKSSHLQKQLLWPLYLYHPIEKNSQGWFQRSTLQLDRL